MNPKVDFFFNEPAQWQAEFEKLRMVILDCDLTEELKWGKPCYSFRDGKVVLIHGFKEYCAVLFFKGALLNDSHNLLIQQTENVQAARQIRFTNLQEIVRLESILKSYLYEAIEIEKAGLEVKLKETSEFKMPAEFKQKLAEMPDLNSAFEALTPGRQRGYLLHFSQPKQAKTRISRIDKCVSKIFQGKGFNEV